VTPAEDSDAPGTANSDTSPDEPPVTPAASNTGFGASNGTSPVTALYGNATPNPDASSRPAGPRSFAVANTRATT
jgi:hypothetical protein